MDDKWKLGFDIDRSTALCYTIGNTPAAPLAARLCATGQVFIQVKKAQVKKALETSPLACYNISKSTRRASDRKVKQAGFLFAGLL
ncbi:MAG: hypothetical protein HY796_00860 [Elusimicrobia bacterium]|nr:hypothetical protein [Elusimicrobiota bacterium]